MARESSNCSPVEITYSILKPFLSGADQDSVELPPYYEIDPRNGVSNRSIAVHVQTRLPKREGRRVSYPFDEIEFSLHGVIKSQVGNKIARRKIVHSVERRRWSDFNKHQRGKNIPSCHLGEEHYCDLNFRLNRPYDSRDATTSQLLPSMSISGSKYITQSTALNDQHLVSGSCDVVYWIEARFVPSTSSSDNVNDQRRLLRSSALNLKPSPNRVRLAPPRSSLKGENKRMEVEAKTSNAVRLRKQCQSLFSGASRQSQVQPRFMFSIEDSLSHDHMLIATSTSTSTFVLPLTMTVFMPPNSSGSATSPNDTLRRYLTSSGFPNAITVTSTWHTKYQISASPASSDSEDEMEKSTVRHHGHVLRLPPFYQSTGSQYTATAELEISVPAGLAVTSDNGLLAVQHFLHLGIKIGEEEKSTSHSTPVSHAAGMTADMRVECIVEM